METLKDDYITIDITPHNSVITICYRLKDECKERACYYGYTKQEAKEKFLNDYNIRETIETIEL